jgi:hypothetical protein
MIHNLGWGIDMTISILGIDSAGCGKEYGVKGVETPITPDEPDDSTSVMGWKRLGLMDWRRVVGCVGLSGRVLL